MRIKFERSEPLVAYPEDAFREDRWKDRVQAKATNWDAPFYAAAKLCVGNCVLAIVVAILLKSPGVALYGCALSVTLAALKLTGVLDLIATAISWIFAPRINADSNMDGVVSEQEAEEALHLFTPQGVAAFVKHWMYEVGDWRYKTLVDEGPFSKDEYNWLVNDILPTVGVLKPEKAHNRTRELEIVDGQSLSLDEAMDRIDKYFKSGKRQKIWQFTIHGMKVTL